ncbi:MAG: response regulator transcription factor [Phycisphaerae bacterium]|jgi:two-component system phosphate regulon response regulator PhoB
MAAEKTILIAEDESDLVELLRYNLERDGYRCRTVSDGEQALAEARRHPPDVMILDRMLPRMSGDEVIARLRGDVRTSAIPILMLTAKGEESDELVGFALGADDYVTKPFSMRLLMARLRALLRRPFVTPIRSDVLSAGPITLDRSRRKATVGDAPVSLTTREFEILWELMAARGRVLSREQLIDTVLGTGAIVTDRTVDVHIAALRKKLTGASSMIQTVRGVGYTLRRHTEAEV